MIDSGSMSLPEDPLKVSEHQISKKEDVLRADEPQALRGEGTPEIRGGMDSI